MKPVLPMPGVIIVPEELDIGRAIADLEVIVECSTAADLENQIQYVPLQHQVRKKLLTLIVP